MMQIGFLLFPNVTQLDLTGPVQILSRLPNSRLHLASKSHAPTPTDAGFSILPTTVFADCPSLDLLCVPGGFGVDAAMRDPDTRAFVSAQGAHARYVTSVCTGAFILGVCGLLKGKKATTHWAYHDLLPLVGAIPTKARVVRDGDVFTGGGVTAGIDFALSIAAEVAGAQVAQRIQLQIEYDPAPPFFAGNPETAPEAVRRDVESAYADRRSVFSAAVRAALA